jgi:hypothetical protein
MSGAVGCTSAAHATRRAGNRRTAGDDCQGVGGVVGLQQLLSVGVVLVLAAPRWRLLPLENAETAFGRRRAPLESLALWDSFRAGIAADPNDRSAEIFGLIEREYWRRRHRRGFGRVGCLRHCRGPAGGASAVAKPPASDRVA